MAVYLQILFMLEKGESATVINVPPYLRALEAPILLPQRITLYSLASKYFTTVAI